MADEPPARMRPSDPAPAKRPPRIRDVLSLPGVGKAAVDDKVRQAVERFNAGVAHFRAGAFEEALTDFDFVARGVPSRSDGWHNKGVALLMLKRFGEAVSTFDAAIRLDVEESDSWDGRGVALGEVGRLDEALQSHDRALQYTTGRAGIWHNRGLAHFALGHHWQAVESFDKANALEPNRFETWAARSMAQARMGRPQDQLVSVEQLVRIDPLSLSAWKLRIELLATLGREKEVKKAKLDLYRAGKDDPDLQFEHGVALAKREKDDRAIECFREAVRLDPSRTDAWAYLASLLGKQAKQADALAAADALLALDATNLDGAITRSRALGELGRLPEALEAAEGATRAHPSEVVAWDVLADLAKRGERPDLVERALRGALALRRRDVPTLHDLGVVLGRQGRTREAFAAFDEALRLSPNSVEVLYSKGAFLEAQGKLREALYLYVEVLRYHPGHKKATAHKIEVEKRLGIPTSAPRPPTEWKVKQPGNRRAPGRKRRPQRPPP